MTQAQRIAQRYAAKTDLNHRLSYASGAQNMAQLAMVKQDIKLRITNSTSAAKKVVLAPGSVLGTELHGLTAANIKTFFDNLGITVAAGTDVVFKAASTPASDTLSIQSLNPDQDRDRIFKHFSIMPTQIQGISIRSYKVDGTPEDSNYSNTIQRHILNTLKPREYKMLSLADYQTSSDVTTNIVKVDFVKENFVAKLSQCDVIDLLVNEGTRLDITIHLGARDSREEYFHRQIEAGTEMLRNEFPVQFSRNRFN